MAEKTLEESIIKKHWYNPLPQARFTERPDVVAAHLLEGHIAIIVDTSPSVMLLPVTIFHFTQHAEDYCQNVAVGTFVRWIRFLGIIGGLILSEMAITVGYFVPETVLYVAISGIGAFATPSLEFAMAIRIFNMFLLVLTGLFNLMGFIAGLIIIFIITFTTKSFENGKRYTWPLIPFDAKPLSNILLRKPIPEIKGN